MEEEEGGLYHAQVVVVVAARGWMGILTTLNVCTDTTPYLQYAHTPPFVPGLKNKKTTTLLIA